MEGGPAAIKAGAAEVRVWVIRWGNRPASLWIAEDFRVLRFRLMVKRGLCICGLKHQKEKRSMDHVAGLDVSVKETSVCIVDDVGKIVREVKVASEPQALLAVLKNPAYHFKRIGSGSRAAVAMALQCTRWSGVTGDLC